MSSFERTYIQERGPAPIAFDIYSAECFEAFNTLLDGTTPESEVQYFLEKNPCLVPGAWTPGSPSGHYPLHCALISQPIIPSLRTRQPDFMWIATDSHSWYPTLIEIEAPGKRIFTKSKIPSAEFTQARNQLAQWRTWFSTTSNVEQFMDSYGLPDVFRYHRTMRMHMILIYGRRREFEADSELSKHRGSLLPGSDEDLMSYDRLYPDEKLQEAITVRASGSGRYRVISIPPVFTLSPQMADRLLQIDSLEEAIDDCGTLSLERKEFLKRRAAYWRQWIAEPGRKIIGGSDTFDE
jgi:hypothetical protein